MNRISQRLGRVLIILLAFTLLISVSTIGKASSQDQELLPTVVSADVLTLPPTPPDKRTIAVLNLVITSSEDGKVRDIKLESQQVIEGYAPNVFGRKGPWSIELIGNSETREYGTLDPRLVRISTVGNEQEMVTPTSPQTTLNTETIWELVVPLYDKEENLEIHTINIRDTSGKPVFSASNITGQFAETIPPQFCSKFSASLQGQKLNSEFLMGSFHFTSVAGPPSFVLIDNVIGLQFNAQGVRVDLPIPANEVMLTLGSHSASLIQISGEDLNGNLLISQAVPIENTLQKITIAKDGLVLIELTGGESEGILTEVCLVNQ